MIHCIHLIESIKREGFARTIYLGVVAVERWRWWRRRPTYMVVVAQEEASVDSGRGDQQSREGMTE
jgi:hypothetical protein